MRKWLLPMALLLLGSTGLPTKAEAPRQVRVTFHTLRGDLTALREMLPKNGKTQEIPSVVLPAQAPALKKRKLIGDNLTVTVLENVGGSLFTPVQPGVSNKLSMVPSLRDNASLTLAVTYERVIEKKTEGIPTIAKALLRKGETLLVAPSETELYAISAEELVEKAPTKAPAKR